MDINPSRPEQQQAGERPLNLSDFAQRNQITEDRVWELIEEGELAARFVNDEILILREQDAAADTQVDVLDAAPELEVQISEPLTQHREPEVAFAAEPDPVTVTTPASDPVANPRPRVEAADEEHPDLPTDDYRDLLLFAQDAMNRTMDLSRQLLSTKDELIRMKDERIQHLQIELQRNEQEIRRLKKKIEDLETLCRLTPNL